MKNKILGLATAIVLSMLASGGLFAQAVPGGFLSPQGNATQGLLRSAADDFIRPDSYAGVTFTNWYAMASFDSTTRAAAGYATKIGGLYLGVFYNGSLWANVASADFTERNGIWLGEADKTVTDYGTLPTVDAQRPYNQLAVLIGVADMGFRLSYRTTHESYDIENFFADGNQYKNYVDSDGLISPQFAWSMAKNLAGDKGIKPWATIDLNFNRDYSRVAPYILDPVTNNWEAEERIGHSENYFNPEFNAGLGLFHFAEKNGWRFSADFAYRLRLWSYDNEYHYTDASGNTQTKSYSGTYASANPADFTELSHSDHRFRPALYTQWNGEKLRLRARLNLDLTIDSRENNVMALNPDGSGSLQRVGTSSSTSTLSFSPDFLLAAQWQVTSIFFLNIGGRITFNAASSTTTETSTYVAGEKVDNSGTKATSRTFGATTNRLALGVTLNPIENFGIEATAGATTSNANGNYLGGNDVNFFDTATGVFVFGNILVSLKF